jgi:hypothetical protein
MAEPGVESAADQAIVRASIVVNASLERAFQVFTAGMGSWWPSTHHIGAAPMVATILEPRRRAIPPRARDRRGMSPRHRALQRFKAVAEASDDARAQEPSAGPAERTSGA